MSYQPSEIANLRDNPPDVFYAEDSQDWLSTYGIPDVLKKGLGLVPGWVEKIDDILLAISTNKAYAQTNEFLCQRSDSWRSGLTDMEYAQILAGIDPSRVKNKIFILDNETPGYFNGVSLVDMLLRTSEKLPSEEKPTIISLMCSNPGVVEDDPKKFDLWDRAQVEVAHKSDYPSFCFWIGRFLQNRELRFRQWYQDTFGYQYPDRRDHIKSFVPTNFQNFTEELRDLTEPSLFGILGRITQAEIQSITQRALNSPDVKEIVAEWGRRYPSSQEGAGRGIER